MGDEIFRKKSLARLSSPEQLDQAIVIIKTKGWIALAGLFLIILTVIIWSIFGSIPEKASGNGVLVSSGKIYSVNAPAAGIVKEVFISNGNKITNGQVIARIEREDLLNQLLVSQQKLDNLKIQYNTLVEYSVDNNKLSEEKSENTDLSLKNQRKHLLRQKNDYQKTLNDYQKLYREGLITNQQLLTAKNDLDTVQAEIDKIDIQVKELSMSNLEFKNNTQKEITALRQNIEEQEKEVDFQEQNYKKQTKVTSSISGTVYEVSISKGDYVSTGTTLVTVEPDTGNIPRLKAMMYFNATEGKKIKRGMTISISPASVKQEEYGYIRGIVTNVSTFPVTNQYMMSILHHEGLASSFSQNSIPIEIQADLIPDSSTASGYKWSSSRGPDIKINSGMLCSGTINVSSKHPIAMVIPTIKKKVFGIGDDQE